MTTARGAVSKVLTVSQLTAALRARIEDAFPRVTVSGEIANWKPASSGHVYFALKDEGALVGAVMWRSTLARMKDAFRDGDLVEATGALSVYEKRGQYQLVVDGMRLAGEGALWKKFQELKARLEAEGLFAAERKRRIPALPSAVGIVTSPTGAAIRDVLSILKRRAPGLKVYVWPARVQGDGAAREVAAGVRALSRSGLVDVMIVGRGGGSLEDLWEFNSELLAREIAASAVPVISAVGHETDFTIADFVADLRAATPSAAAELVSRDRAQTLAAARSLADRLDRAMRAPLDDARHRLRRALDSHALRRPELRVREAQQRADDAVRRMDAAVRERMVLARHRAANATAALQGHDPGLILKKGYAIVRNAATGKVIPSAKGAKPGAHVRTQFVDGTMRSVVVKDEADLFEGGEQ